MGAAFAVFFTSMGVVWAQAPSALAKASGISGAGRVVAAGGPITLSNEVATESCGRKVEGAGRLGPVTARHNELVIQVCKAARISGAADAKAQKCLVDLKAKMVSRAPETPSGIPAKK